jgi:hypothetical protein
MINHHQITECFLRPSKKKMKVVPQVSSLGRVRNCRGVVTTPTPRSSGYVRVKINKKTHLIHRLIAVAFELERKAGQDTVDHIDGNPSNNSLSNLRWATQSEQTAHSYATNANRKSNALKLSKPVRGRRVGEEVWKEYPSAKAAARNLGLNQGHVSDCCAGKQTQTGGFVFQLAMPTEPESMEGEEWRDVVL